MTAKSRSDKKREQIAEEVDKETKKQKTFGNLSPPFKQITYVSGQWRIVFPGGFK